MNSRVVNIVLAAVVVVLLALLASRVSFGTLAGSGSCCGKGSGCGLGAKDVLQGRLK